MYISEAYRTMDIDGNMKKMTEKASRDEMTSLAEKFFAQILCRAYKCSRRVSLQVKKSFAKFNAKSLSWKKKNIIIHN